MPAPVKQLCEFQDYKGDFTCPYNKPPHNLPCISCNEWSGGPTGFCGPRFLVTGERF